MIAFDVESTGLSPFKGDQMFALSIYDGKKNYYWSWPVDLRNRKVDYSKTSSEQLDIITKFLCSNEDKVGHNVKFDLKMIKKCLGIVVNTPIHDTMIAAKCCNASEPKFGLKELSQKYLKITDKDEKDLKKEVIRLRSKVKKFAKLGISPENDYFLAPELCKKYCCMDTYRTYKLFEFYKEGMKQLNVLHTYNKEMKLLPIFLAMEERGVRIDHLHCINEIKRCNQELETIRKEVVKHSTNKSLNLNSSQQLAKFLFTDLKLQPVKETKGGNLSTDVSVLKYYKDIPAVNLLLKYRGLEKGKSYFEGCLEDISLDEFRTVKDLPEWTYFSVHPDWRQYGAKTGRVSCANPNLTNVANEETSSGENVQNIRPVYTVRQGYRWLIADYSQLELRIFASRSGEPTLLEAFRRGRDVHDETRKSIDLLASLPEKRGRKIAKNINFLKINGGGAGTLSEKYDVPYSDAVNFLKAYDEKYTTINEHINACAEFAVNNDCLMINAYNRKIPIEFENAYTQASSSDIQSSAADLVKNAMIRIHNYFLEKNFDAHILMMIHDELVIEINEKIFTYALAAKIKSLMENTDGVFEIPMPVECSYSTTNWAEKKKMDL